MIDNVILVAIAVHSKLKARTKPSLEEERLLSKIIWDSESNL